MSDDPENGLGFDIICVDVPVVHLTSKSPFHVNAAWMLQEVLGSHRSAHQLYEECHDVDIQDELKDRKITGAFAANLKERPEVRAVGIGGKRSVMLALCAARTLKFPREISRLNEVSRLSEELHGVNLYGDFREMLSMLQNYMSEAAGERDQRGQRRRPQEEERGMERETINKDEGPLEKLKFEEYGIEVFLVCGSVPVIGMGKASCFSEHASWLLQTAIGFHGKVDTLFKWHEDLAVMEACQKAGLKNNEIYPAKISHQPLLHVMAVGTGGKRSVMLAMVVALLLLGESSYSKIKSEMINGCPKLIEPLSRLLEAVSQLSGKRIPGLRPDGDYHAGVSPPRKNSNSKTGVHQLDPDDWNRSGPSSKRRRETYGQSR